MPIREKGPRRAGWWPVGPLSRHNPCPDRRENRASSTVAAEFTGETDSAAEGEGFEPPVPLAKQVGLCGRTGSAAEAKRAVSKTSSGVGSTRMRLLDRAANNRIDRT